MGKRANQLEFFDACTDPILAAGDYPLFKQRMAASACQRCGLARSRTNIVVDRGNPAAKVLFVGEAPGETEDLQGRAFVGRAGRLLDSLLEEIGIDSENDILIINIVKCRPPENRAPSAEEAQSCRPYLKKQFDLVRPEVVVLMGATALKYFAEKRNDFSMQGQAGKLFEVPEFPGVQFVVLYHPAYLLYDPRKRPVMKEHLQRLRLFLEERRRR